MEIEFRAELWRWKAREATSSSWFFVTLPKEASDEIEDRFGGLRGFGSVRVEVTVGATTWRTSIFPSSEHEAFVLPLKMAVRTAEGLSEDAIADVHLTVVDS